MKPRDARFERREQRRLEPAESAATLTGWVDFSRPLRPDGILKGLPCAPCRAQIGRRGFDRRADRHDGMQVADV
jgi:hypothetical protein